MNNTPDSPAQTPDDRMDQGRNYWTLFTPGTWKLLHAVSQQEARRDLFAYVEGFYNRERLHSGLGYRTPTWQSGGHKA